MKKVTLILILLAVAVLGFYILPRSDRRAPTEAPSTDDAPETGSPVPSPRSPDVTTRGPATEPASTPPQDPVAPPGAEPAPDPSTTSESRPPDSELIDAPPTAGPNRSPAPPGAHSLPSPLNLEMQIHQFVQRVLVEQGPDAGEQARGLFISDDPVMRMIGAAILGELGELDDAALGQIAGEKDPAHALAVLGWLQDHGQAEEASRLRDGLAARNISSEELINLFLDGNLEGIGGRATLDLLEDTLSDEDRHNLFLTIANDASQTYDVRMKALVDLRSSMDLVSYRAAVENVRQATQGGDALWDEGIKRLGQRLQGPVELMQGPVSVSPQDIDLMVAREYPRMLEDLALHLEYAVDQDSSRLATGTAARLQAHLEKMDQMPWTAEQTVSLSRLHNLAEIIASREQDYPELSGNAPPGL